MAPVFEHRGRAPFRDGLPRHMAGPAAREGGECPGPDSIRQPHAVIRGDARSATGPAGRTAVGLADLLGEFVAFLLCQTADHRCLLHRCLCRGTPVAPGVPLLVPGHPAPLSPARTAQKRGRTGGGGNRPQRSWALRSGRVTRLSTRDDVPRCRLLGAQERRRSLARCSVLKERPLPLDPFHGALRAVRAGTQRRPLDS